MLFRKDSGSAATNLPATKTNRPSGSVAIPEVRKSPLESFKGDGVVLVGKGTRLTGEIKDSSMIEIQGDFEGDVIADAVIVREGATFRGNMKTEYAEIHGLVEGAILADQLLDIRSTGFVSAEVRYGHLSVATGGQLSGNIASQQTIDGIAEQSAEQTAEPASQKNGAVVPMNGAAHSYNGR